jgi:hypothetical protein
MVTHFQETDRVGELTVSEPYFILVQGGCTLDSSQHPSALMWSLLDPEVGFKVAIGVIDEYGHREIVGICAEFSCYGGDTFYLTSDMDGYMRMINLAETSVEIIKSRLYQLYSMKRFSDPFNFSKIKLYQGGCMG